MKNTHSFLFFFADSLIAVVALENIPEKNFYGRPT
jgi:hypothetical protein